MLLNKIHLRNLFNTKPTFRYIAPSKHSRAARRATSPGIDTDKSLKEIQPPRQTKFERPSVLAVHHSAGVQKKSGKRKGQLSAKAKRRQQRGMEMAEAIMERTSKKVQKSSKSQRTVQERRKAWEDINRLAAEENDGNDDNDDEVEVNDAASKAAGNEWEETDEEVDDAAPATEEVANAPAAQLDDDLDEIL